VESTVPTWQEHPAEDQFNQPDIGRTAPAAACPDVECDGHSDQSRHSDSGRYLAADGKGAMTDATVWARAATSRLLEGVHHDASS
jgi:hypothetical protein